MLATGANVERAGFQSIIRLSLFHPNAGELGQLQGVLAGEGSRHVLDEKDGCRKVAGEAGGQAHYGGRSTGGRG